MHNGQNRPSNPSTQTGRDLQSLHASNLSALLSAIWNNSPISRLELARSTGLALSSVTRLLQELAQAGLVKEFGKGESSGGRQPALIVPNPDAGLVISLDLSGINLRAGIFDAANHLISAYEQPYYSLGPESIRSQVLEIIPRLLADPAVQDRRLLGIGVSLPGTVDKASGAVLDSYNLKLHNFPLGQILSAEFHLPVYIEHDASVAALAERYYGAGRGASHFIYVLVSTGIGSGIIVDGEIYRGETGKPGELGHIILNRDGQFCVCGKRGCLEAEAAGPAMVAGARQIFYRDPILSALAGGEPEAISVKMIMEAARQGDAFSRDILTKTADLLAQGISIYAALLDMRLFIVGGDVLVAGEFFLGLLSQAIEKYRREGIEIHLTPAKLTGNTFLQGVSMLTLQETLIAHL